MLKIYLKFEKSDSSIKEKTIQNVIWVNGLDNSQQWEYSLQSCCQKKKK